MLLLCLSILLISMTGCSTRYVAIETAGPDITVKKSEFDRLHADNEALLNALSECRNAR
ncbi:hypothetical protein GSbR_37450 [Geobacter sp. SVR]|nr:hypothetical protein GSVR_28530 [Geobacter sp. SVR]GCF87145.1 hypothetical protein GSbR_37450 [Geobacter sp. SVR]